MQDEERELNNLQNITLVHSNILQETSEVLKTSEVCPHDVLSYSPHPPPLALLAKSVYSPLL